MDRLEAAKRLSRVTERLLDHHKDMTLIQALVLFRVAEKPGISQRDLYKYLGLNDSTVSRTLAILSDVGGRQAPPLNLVDVRISPEDRRERLLDLTPKGKRFLDDIATTLGDTNEHLQAG
jgi:DNA-binding MarR family transcriptional regulator